MWKFIILSVTLVNLPEYGYFSYAHSLHLLVIYDMDINEHEKLSNIALEHE
jgi:hypothetical protein